MKTLDKNTLPIMTDWFKLDMDFSDSDSIDFTDFEVDIDEFKQGKKNGYVVDTDGVKRIIDKVTVKLILEDYEENWGD
jgi:hypothetical protein